MIILVMFTRRCYLKENIDKRQMDGHPIITIAYLEPMAQGS